MSYSPTDGFAEIVTEPGMPGSTQESVQRGQKRTTTETTAEEIVLAPENLEEPLFVETEPAVEITRAIPLPVFPLIKNKVYGSYKGVSGSFELELRIDVDGINPLQKVSGDFFSISGATKTYFGSFVADNVSTTRSNGLITITGMAQTTWNTAYKKIKVTIRETTMRHPLAPAQIQWFHSVLGTPGAIYVCHFTKRGFRFVRLEQDCTANVTPFVSYTTSALPSGSPAKVLSVPAAYAEAGVDMVNGGIANVVPLNLAGVDGRWSDAELHNAMVNHFSLYADKPVWDVWLLHAYEHVLGPGLYGIMFDQQGLQRQGCAVFYRGIGGSTAEQKRLQLFTCVHELGHCFNLMHSWQKSLALPQKGDRPRALSWMNYPWGYPDGAAAFWNAFAFQFDALELAHIRHGFRNNVIMGGNPFRVGASLENIAALFDETIENTSNLELELEAKKSYKLGEPVVLETKLKTTSFKNVEVVSNLHADLGFITIGVKKPGGEIVVYEPLAEKCVMPEKAILNLANPGIYESSYIGFDKNGFLFDHPGLYQIRAVYYHEDGSRIVSDTLTIRVTGPLNEQEEEIGDLYMTSEAGYLFKFLGSDAPYLQRANNELALVADKYRDHPLAVYAQFAQGVNAQRTFKTITPSKDVVIRQPNFREGTRLLNTVIEKSKSGVGLDNISLNDTMQLLAKTYQREGNREAAQATVNDLINHFNQKPIKQSIKDKIAREATAILQTRE